MYPSVLKYKIKSDSYDVQLADANQENSLKEDENDIEISVIFKYTSTTV